MAGKKLKVNGLEITWLGHASFLLEYIGIRAYIDPYVLPQGGEPKKADAVFVTHKHYDHCADENIRKVSISGTIVVAPDGCTSANRKIAEGETMTIAGIKTTAVPAYNVDKKFHPRGLGVGYVLTFPDGTKIYHAGDTDFIPEMANLAAEKLDVALLPIGGTYTMDRTEAEQAAVAIKPKIVVPMHFNCLEGTATDPNRFRPQDKSIKVVILE